jgi:hypothetical protein
MKDNSKVYTEMQRFENERKKMVLELEKNKKQMIREIKSIDKSEMNNIKVKKISFWKKLKIVFGYGKNR